MESAMRSLTSSAPGSRTAKSCDCWKAARRSKFFLKTGGARSKNRETERCGFSAAPRAQANWKKNVQIVTGHATARSARSFAATRKNVGSLAEIPLSETKSETLIGVVRVGTSDFPEALGINL